KISLMDDKKIQGILKGTFGPRPQPEYSIAALQQDINDALHPVTRISEDKLAAKWVKKSRDKLAARLNEIENSPENRFILFSVGRNYAAVAKDKGIRARNMPSYDKIVGSTGFSHYEDFVNNEVEEFFRIRKQ